MLKTRIMTALIGIPLLLGVLYAGELYRVGLFLLMAFVAMAEFSRMMRQAGRSNQILPAYLLLFALLLVPDRQEQLAPLLFIALLAAVFKVVVDYPRTTYEDTALIMFFALYLGVCLTFALKLSRLDQGFEMLVLALVLTWASDVGGYAAGNFWGKRKLTPQLSPNKTWAGAWGGIALTAGLSVIFFMVTDMTVQPSAYALLLGIVSSIGAQFGDLFMSAVKRFFAVKDSGHLIPGHGGVLDRFDSFLVVAPIVYFFVQHYR